MLDVAEAIGAGGYALIGLATCWPGGVFLVNVLPLGQTGNAALGRAPCRSSTSPSAWRSPAASSCCSRSSSRSTPQAVARSEGAMSFLPYVVAAWLFLIGLYGIVTSRNLIHLTVCLAVVQSSTYVLLLSIGYRAGAGPPIFANVPAGTPAVDPVVQALTLTDIVVERHGDGPAAGAGGPGPQAPGHARPARTRADAGADMNDLPPLPGRRAARRGRPADGDARTAACRAAVRDAIAIATAVGGDRGLRPPAGAALDGPIVYWFGGWAPRDGVALGICFVIDPFGAGLACWPRL